MIDEPAPAASTTPDGAGSAADLRQPARPMLEVCGVWKRFPKLDVPVLQDVDVTVPEGRFTTLIGPSGCGKTTLLRMVGGLEEVTRGSVKVDGAPSMGPSLDKTMVFQHFHLFPWRSALSNIAYGLELRGVGKRERLARARHYLELVGLDGFGDHYPAELSGGMQQRVGIARALAIEPKLLLMDEPFGALDALTRENLQTELLKICAQTGVTVLFVTHSIDEAIYLSDHIVVMGRGPGRVVAEFDVELPRPRWTYTVRATPRFMELREALWTELSKVMSGSTSGRQVITE